MFNFNRSDVGLIILNSSYKVVRTNKKIRDIFNIKSWQLRKHGLQKIFDKDTYAKIIEAIAANEVTAIPFSYNNKDFEIHIGYLLARKEHYTILLITDITKLKLEQNIKENLPKIIDHIIKTNSIIAIYADIIKKNATNSYVKHAATVFKKNILSLNKMLQKLKQYIEH